MNVLICGVGGQGTVLASKILAHCAMTRGEKVYTAETIGMAQRGGSVTSHVRIGNAHSPLIAKMTADIIIAFEPGEAARNILFLKNDGVLILSDRGIIPAVNGLYSPLEVFNWLREKYQKSVIISADEVNRISGTYRALNIALLGAALNTLGYTFEEMEFSIKSLMSAKNAEANLPALRYGFEIGRGA